jgi:hypothetical protein
MVCLPSFVLIIESPQVDLVVGLILRDQPIPLKEAKQVDSPLHAEVIVILDCLQFLRICLLQHVSEVVAAGLVFHHLLVLFLSSSIVPIVAMTQSTCVLELGLHLLLLLQGVVNGILNVIYCFSVLFESDAAQS